MDPAGAEEEEGREPLDADGRRGGFGGPDRGGVGGGLEVQCYRACI